MIQIMGLLGMYFDATVVFVTSRSLIQIKCVAETEEICFCAQKFPSTGDVLLFMHSCHSTARPVLGDLIKFKSLENLSNHLVLQNQSDLNCFKLPVVIFALDYQLSTFRLISLCLLGDITGRRQSSLAHLLREGTFSKKENGLELLLEQLSNWILMSQQLEL